MASATVARRLSVLRGAYKQLAAKGLISWEIAQDIAAVEVHGAGQQQLRPVWANVGAWNLIGWWHTLVELWAWDRPQSRLRDRSDSPWDKRHGSNAGHSSGVAGVDVRRATPLDPRLARRGSLAVASSTPATPPLLSPAKIRELNHA